MSISEASNKKIQRYLCVDCLKVYKEIVAEHNNFKCSACGGDLRKTDR